jgi:DNA-binding response OmpR family regulator
VRRRGEIIKLTPTEFKLLVTLMEHPGRVIPSEDLVTRVWGPEYAGQVDYVRRYVWYLRQKLEEDPDAPRYIQNERNVGYCFAEQPEEPQEHAPEAHDGESR